MFFSNTKKNISVILIFRKQCLTGHAQRLPFTMGAKGDQEAAKCNTEGLQWGMVSVKYDFRSECFFTLMYLLTYFVAAFVCI